MTLRIILIVALAYLGVMILVYLLQRRMVYFPTRDVTATPSDVGLRYDDVTLTASDGVKLDAWFVPAKDSPGVILLCHGNGGNIGHRVELLSLLHRVGWSVLIFDYRGYGRSEGTPGEAGTYRDARAAWEYLANERGFARDKIVIHGRSLGGGVASWLAATHPPRALILESTFTSLPDAGAHHYPFLPVRLLSRFRYPTTEHLKKIACPVLVIHSPDDRIVPYELGEKVFKIAAEPKTFLTIHGSHNEGVYESRAVYTTGLRRFLTGQTPATTPTVD